MSDMKVVITDASFPDVAAERLAAEAENAELQRIPNDTKALAIEPSVKFLKMIEAFEEEDDVQNVYKFLETLDDHDDVQNVYHNLEMTDELMAALESE